VVSIVKFLAFLKLFCLSERPWRIQIAADNQSFITKVNQAMAYEKPFPNVTMDPDYDLIAEVVHTVRESNPNLDVTFVHVLGHQDARTEFADLSLFHRIWSDIRHR
jgi:N-acetyl-beta-hexosaminidase